MCAGRGYAVRAAAELGGERPGRDEISVAGPTLVEAADKPQRPPVVETPAGEGPDDPVALGPEHAAQHQEGRPPQQSSGLPLVAKRKAGVPRAFGSERANRHSRGWNVMP